MAWIINAVKCKCGKFHDLCLPREDMPSMSERYKYACPTTGDGIIISPNAAATHVNECPDGAVTITEVGAENE